MGLHTFLDLLEFVISLMVSEGEGVHTDLDIFGLELMTVALNSGGACFGRHPALLQLLRQDVWAALALAACRPNLATLSQACQVGFPPASLTSAELESTLTPGRLQALCFQPWRLQITGPRKCDKEGTPRSAQQHTADMSRTAMISR